MMMMMISWYFGLKISWYYPACNVQSRADELEHVALWARANSLKLNRVKTVEVIFTDSRRKLQPCCPPELPDIRRATSIRMLGVTLTNHLSVSDHVRDVISRCAQSLHALKIMRCHGMNSDALKTVYKSVVLAKLLYASPAWWGFATSSDKGRIEAHVRRAVRLNLYHDTDPTQGKNWRGVMGVGPPLENR